MEVYTVNSIALNQLVAFFIILELETDRNMKMHDRHNV